VTGLAEPGGLLRKSGLRPGDALVLTKPLGTGIVLAGHMHGLGRAAWLAAAIASMRTSNAAASRVLRASAATACTGVTGFGLAGHLMEMLRASGVAAVLWADAVPALPGALELAAHGVESALAAQNRRVLSGTAPSATTALLFDPQTSGGLLAGVPAEKVQACVAALRRHHLPAIVIGMVEAGDAALRLDTAADVTRDTA
jgi:selenide,water dikinase